MTRSKIAKDMMSIPDSLEDKRERMENLSVIMRHNNEDAEIAFRKLYIKELKEAGDEPAMLYWNEHLLASAINQKRLNELAWEIEQIAPDRPIADKIVDAIEKVSA